MPLDYCSGSYVLVPLPENHVYLELSNVRATCEVCDEPVRIYAAETDHTYRVMAHYPG